jgi:ribonucleoside-diphosphate reductase alpha chain
VRRGNTADIVSIAVAADDEAIAAQLQRRFAQWFGASGNATARQGHIQLQYAGSAATLLIGLGLTAVRAHEKRVPESIFAAPRDAVVGFLRGLFSADGSVQSGPLEKGTCSVRLATSSKGLAQDVQQLLLNLGIVSEIRLRRDAQIRLMPNAARESAEYATQTQYEVIIDKANRDRFAEVVGFMQEGKQRRLQDWIAAKKRTSNRESFTTKVALIEDAGTADVYDTTVPELHSIIVNGLATAQCGEQWLGPYDACNLGSINLGLFVKDGEIDWAGLEEATRLTTRFLDDVIEINPYPLNEVRDKVRANRRIGLGVMGWAEMLFELNIRYDSEEAVALGEKVMVAIQDWSTDESAKLAEVRGAFPNWERSIYKNGEKLRNSTRTTVAPTGSISILADCSSGIEPIFALAFQHRVKQPDGSYRVLDFVNPFFARALAASDIVEKEEVLAYIKEHGSLHGHPAEEHPALAPYVTAHEIAPEWHIRMQAAFQKGVNNSISKTINLPNSATYDDVRNAYMLAWDLGCLGITVFRDGSKGEQVLNVGVKDKQPEAGAAAPASVAAQAEVEERRRRYYGGIKERPEVIQGYTRQVRAPEGKVNVTLNSDEDGLLEVFVNIGKAGSDVAALAEAMGRLISLHLRIDSPISQNQRAEEVARQLRAIGGSTSIGFGADRVRSLPDAMARAIDLHLASLVNQPEAEASSEPAASADESSTSSGHGSNGYGNGYGNGLSNGGNHLPGLNPMMLAPYSVTGNLCTQCGNNTMRYEEGCKKCVSCGYSEC